MDLPRWSKNKNSNNYIRLWNITIRKMPDKVEPHVTLWNLEKSEKGLFIEHVHLREMFVYHGQWQANVCFN